jgi:hypothetical protein
MTDKNIRYKVEVKRLEKVPNDKYPSQETVYEQVFDELDLKDLVNHLNIKK